MADFSVLTDYPFTTPPVPIFTKVQSCTSISFYLTSLLQSLLFVSSSSDRILGLITLTLPACLSLTRLCPDSHLSPLFPSKALRFPPGSWNCHYGVDEVLWRDFFFQGLFFFLRLICFKSKIDFFVLSFPGPDHTSSLQHSADLIIKSLNYLHFSLILL